MENRIKIMIVDDHPLVKEGLKSVFKKKLRFNITAEAASGREAINKMKIYKPDVILMDINMPGISGIETARILKSEFPEVKIIGLSMHESKEYVSEFIRLGADGYVLKDSPPAEIIAAIESVFNNKTYFCTEVKEAMIKEQIEKIKKEKSSIIKEKCLSSREYEVLIKLAMGLTNKETASDLSLSIRTVEVHRNHIMHKLDVKNVAGIVKYAIKEKLLHLEEII